MTSALRTTPSPENNYVSTERESPCVVPCFSRSFFRFFFRFCFFFFHFFSLFFTFFSILFQFFSGFSEADRGESVRRVGETSCLFSDSGTITIVSLVSPYR